MGRGVREKESTSDDIYMTFLKSEKSELHGIGSIWAIGYAGKYAFQWLHGTISRWILNVLWQIWNDGTDTINISLTEHHHL